MKRILAALAGALILTTGATAQDYPSEPVDMIVGYAAGGTSDTATRIVAEALSQELGQPVVVQNRPGAATTVASNWVANQDADGYTLYAAAVSLVLNPLLQPSVDYDADADFTPIATLVEVPFVLHVNPELGVSDMAGLVELIKQKPGELAVGTSGAGAINHLIAEYFMDALGLDLIVVHYQGDAPARQDLLAGNIQMSFTAATVALPLVEAGKTTGIAVTSADRLSDAPNLPTVAEAAELPDFEATYWMALVVPAGTPDKVVSRLSAAMEKLGGDDSLRQALLERGLVLNVMDAQATEARFANAKENFGRIIENAGLAAN